VHTLLQDANEESFILGQSCTDPDFENPVVFEWTQEFGSCENIWTWANGSQDNYSIVTYQSIDIRFRDELPSYKTTLRRDYAIPYSYLKENVPYVHFQELGNHVKTNKICMFGDSQMQAFLNSVIVCGDVSASCLPNLENMNIKESITINCIIQTIPAIQSCAQVLNSGQWPSGPPTIPPSTLPDI
jgi:hypothetical protein